MTNEDIDRAWSELEWRDLNPTEPGFNEALRHRFACAIIAQARAELIAEQWIPAGQRAPHCEGQYVVRINRHGHIRMGERVLNSDTLCHQWQVGGEVCNTITHYHPIPPLTLSKE